MKILIVNKFLYPNGGSETYIFGIGRQLAAMGHQVQYFGMEHEGRCVGNAAGAYTRDMDFHGGSKLARITYPLKTIYSAEARRKIRLVLEDFRPDVVHLNNFTYQLTPSIILEIRKWERESGRAVRIVFTAHDYNLICPNHMLHNPGTQENCVRCLGGHYLNCLKGRCIHGSAARSAVGTAEALFWNHMDVYRQIDTVICCSAFMKSMMDTSPVFAGRTVVMHNFVDPVSGGAPAAGRAEASAGVPVSERAPARTDRLGEGDIGGIDGIAGIAGLPAEYILYFGRFAKEKGIGTLLEVCRELKDIPFVFAGSGPLEEEVNAAENVKNVGFQTGKALARLIRGALFAVYPSEWYENCPFSVMESQMYGTPVLGADIGGIPELIGCDGEGDNEFGAIGTGNSETGDTGSLNTAAAVGATGELFESGNAQELCGRIRALWADRDRLQRYRENCRAVHFDTAEEYCDKLVQTIYRT